MNWFDNWKMDKKLTVTYEGLVPPTKAEPHAVGYDIMCLETVPFLPFEKKLVDLGIKVQIPDGYYLLLYQRSSTGSKNPFMLTNCVGIIDPKYRQTVYASVINLSPEPAIMEQDKYYFQFIIQPIYTADFVRGTVADTTRGGFGSTR